MKTKQITRYLADIELIAHFQRERLLNKEAFAKEKVFRCALDILIVDINKIEALL